MKRFGGTKTLEKTSISGEWQLISLIGIGIKDDFGFPGRNGEDNGESGKYVYTFKQGNFNPTPPFKITHPEV